MDSVKEKARAFFAPLRGRSVTFIINDRHSGFLFAKSLAAMVSASGETCSILDLDAFYASNADVFFDLPTDFDMRRVSIHIPRPTSRIEDEFPRLFTAAPSMVLVDTLNTLFHLLSSDEGVYRGRKFSLAVASLTFAAKQSQGIAMLTMYRREALGRRAQGRTMSSYSDLAVAVQARNSELFLLTERGTAWVDGSLSIRIP